MDWDCFRMDSDGFRMDWNGFRTDVDGLVAKFCGPPPGPIGSVKEMNIGKILAKSIKSSNHLLLHYMGSERP